ncbi:MAG: prolipoprotein diacylglyceryl transferase [Cyclobacteriaceae bacterium]|nr:prolipoprotein diacylglyceryl transferase [Cyclobacteriaceae bacterium SS2]
MLSFLIWSPDPDFFTIPVADRPVRWYGLLFALGFIISQQVLMWIFRKDGKPEKAVETLTVYMVIATVVGARLGHCLFYAPEYYLSDPIKILYVWEGGLASHGGAIGILVALYLFVRKYKEYRLFWVLDRMAIVVALTGALIRTGNFMNSEMEGLQTNSSTGVVYARFTEEVVNDALNYGGDRVTSIDFEKGGDLESDQPGLEPVTVKVAFARNVQITEQDKQFVESRLRQVLLGYEEVTQHIDFRKDEPLAYKFYEEGGINYLEVYGLGIVRHAAQLYEATYCVLIFLLLLWLWKEKRYKLPEGFMFGLFMTLLWSLRFVDEFFKMNQEEFEEGMVLNMGQWLSIPMALIGVAVMVWAIKKGHKPESPSAIAD